jgi:hypothetical protein
MAPRFTGETASTTFRLTVRWPNFYRLTLDVANGQPMNRLDKIKSSAKSIQRLIFSALIFYLLFSIARFHTKQEQACGDSSPHKTRLKPPFWGG